MNRTRRAGHSGGVRNALSAALGIALAAGAPIAGAATIEVTTPDDAGTTTTCTLRQAIAAMNAGAVGPSASCANSAGAFGTSDTITFAPSVATVTLADLPNNELLITNSNLTITGSGMGGVTVSRVSGATNAFRIFHDTAAATGNDLYLSGLTISNGATTAMKASGGAIFMDGIAELVGLTDCIVSGNSTAGAYAVGGAIAAGRARNQGTVTLTNSTVAANSTAGDHAAGGAIYAGHQADLMDSIVSGNATHGTSSPGGAIQTQVAVVYSSTLDNNATHGDYSGGGAIASLSTYEGPEGSYDTFIGNNTAGKKSPGGAIDAGNTGTLSYLLVSGNSTSGDDSDGGGIYAFDRVTVFNSVISGNTVSGAASSGGGVAGQYVLLRADTLSGNHVSGDAGVGGALWLESGSIRESTVSGNTAVSGGGGVELNACQSTSPLLTIYNSTLAFNTTTMTGGATFYVTNSACASSPPTSTTVKFVSSLFSNTTAAGAASAEFAAQSSFALTVDTSFDLVQRVPTSVDITLTNATDTPALITADPTLLALSDNGCGLKSGAPGSAVCRPTQSITRCSAAHRGGSNPTQSYDDERGTGFPRYSPQDSTVDIGAYEIEPTDDDIFCYGFESGTAQ